MSRNVTFCLISSIVSGLPDFLTVVSDRILRVFNRSGAARTVTLYISKAFVRVWRADLLHKSSLTTELQVGYLALFHPFLVIDGFPWLFRKSFKEYPVNVRVSQDSIRDVIYNKYCHQCSWY